MEVALHIFIPSCLSVEKYTETGGELCGHSPFEWVVYKQGKCWVAKSFIYFFPAKLNVSLLLWLAYNTCDWEEDDWSTCEGRRDELQLWECSGRCSNRDECVWHILFEFLPGTDRRYKRLNMVAIQISLDTDEALEHYMASDQFVFASWGCNLESSLQYNVDMNVQFNNLWP